MRFPDKAFCRVLVALAGLAALSLALPACRSKEESTRAASDDGRSTAAPSSLTPRINVIESTDPDAGSSCTDPATRTADYEAFIEQALPRFGHPLTPETLDAQIQALDDGAVPLETTKLSRAELTTRILQGLNIEFLVNGIDERKLEVKTTAVLTANGTVERDLVFVDPWVGTFKGILLMPEGPGPFPVVIAIHGHPDNAEIYRDSYHGKDFPGHGYAILMLTMRAMAIDEAEHQISMNLLKAGFTLVGMRVYETLLGLKFLNFLASKDRTIDSARIGLIGHSGGSSACDLTVRIEPRFRTYVSDNSVDWHRSDGPWEKFTGKLELYHCETVPALFPINEQIRDFLTSATPIDKVPYATAKTRSGNDRIVRFFNRTLKK